MKYLIDEELDFEKSTNKDIVNHLIKTNHAFLKEELPEIEELVFTIYRVHFTDSGYVLEKVHKLFGKLKIELESHMIKEERVLFHMIKDYESNPLEELRKDIIERIEDVKNNDKEIKSILKELRIVTDDYTVPPSGCPTYVNTYNKIEEIEKDTLGHFKLEDILFSRI